MLNKVMFIGHLGRDVELRYLPSGVAVANFSVASSEKWKDKDGNPHEETEWLRCTAFERIAEVCGEYLHKGSLIYVEGKLRTRKYTDKDGIEKYATECTVKAMKMLSARESDGSDSPASDSPRRAPAARPTPSTPRLEAGPEAGKPGWQPAAGNGPGDSGLDDMEDDLIPF